MIAVISPAKSIKFDEEIQAKNLTVPSFRKESEALIAELRKIKVKDVSKLMDISDELGQLNFERYKTWKQPDLKNGAKPVSLVFKGDVYRGMNAADFSSADFDFAQKHLRILSGLHGLLRPLDVIFPYRLEMGTGLKTKAGKNLYEFWGDKITEKLNEDLGKDDVLINLASNEYFKVVHPKKLKAKIIACEFKDFKNGKYISIMTFAKLARGYMARYIVKNKIEKPEKLKGFDSNDYSFNAKMSDEVNWVFTRG